MQEIKDSLIREKILKEYNFNTNKYGEQCILGTFVIGKCNYGFAETVRDLNYVTIYLPSLEDLCIGTVSDKEKEGDNLIDIRKFISSPVYLHFMLPEIIYTDYYIINKKYKRTFKNLFVKNINLITNYNKKQKYRVALQLIQTAFSNNQDIFEGTRLSIAMKMLDRGATWESCMNITDPVYQTYLWSVAHGSTTIDKKKIVKEMQQLVDETHDSYDFDGAFDTIKQAIFGMMTKSLITEEEPEEIILEDKLKEKELLALAEIKNRLPQGSGTISISVLTTETNISRTIYKNLFDKMVTYKYAIIENRGVKGTYIEFITKKDDEDDD